MKKYVPSLETSDYSNCFVCSGPHSFTIHNFECLETDSSIKELKFGSERTQTM
jgi:hypothetical protein